MVTTSFKRELKKQIRMAVTAAIGFIIAFTWRESIISFIQSSTQNLSNVTNPILLQNISALTTTILGVVLILITSKILKD